MRTDILTHGSRNVHPIRLLLANSAFLSEFCDKSFIPEDAEKFDAENAEKKSQAPEAHCTRKSPLPLLPSGPGGVGGKASRGTDA
jgi:hypothetical protein